MVLAHYVAAFLCVLAGVYGLTVSDRKSTSLSAIIFLTLGAGQLLSLIPHNTHAEPLFRLEPHLVFSTVAGVTLTAVVGGIVWYSRNTKTSVAVEQ